MQCPSCGTEAGDISKFCPSCGSQIVRADKANDEYAGKMFDGKYRVEEMIGEGGMGKVYKAIQIRLDKKVVLKVLRRSLLTDERTVARFEREAKAASRLSHPNSISVLDFGRADDGVLYIAMEYVEGKDLHHILSKEWPLPEARVVRIISQVLSALSDAHSVNVIHRDLKPENIMVGRRGNEADYVKVLDFGIAKITDSTGEEGPSLTRTGFVCGTPEYMSPEQARGAMLDARSDLYAVGVILYQLTSGLLPFESDSAVGFATKHLSEEPPPPSKRRPDAKISPAMEQLIMRALRKKPDERPQNADAFKQELLAVVARPMQLVAPAARRTNGPGDKPPLGPSPKSEGGRGGAAKWGEDQTVRTAMSAINAAPGDQTILVPFEQASGTTGAFKVVTFAMIAISALLAGFYLYDNRSEPEPFVVPDNAPVPEAELSKSPLYERDIPRQRRDLAQAAALMRDGDQAHRAGDLALAETKYRQAFEHNPDPELSLKLGELFYQRNRTQEARGWWRRHLRDASDSKARRYIQQAYSDL